MKRLFIFLVLVLATLAVHGQSQIDSTDVIHRYLNSQIHHFQVMKIDVSVTEADALNKGCKLSAAKKLKLENADFSKVKDWNEFVSVLKGLYKTVAICNDEYLQMKLSGGVDGQSFRMDIMPGIFMQINISLFDQRAHSITLTKGCGQNENRPYQMSIKTNSFTYVYGEGNPVYVKTTRGAFDSKTEQMTDFGELLRVLGIVSGS